MTSITLTAAQLAEKIHVDVKGNDAVELTHVASLECAQHDALSFIVSKQYLKKLQATKAAAVIVPEDLVDECPTTALVAKNPHLSFAHAASLLHPQEHVEPGIHPSAVVHGNCQIGKNVHIGPNVVISHPCSIADDCYIGPGTIINSDASIGQGSRLIARVTIAGPVVIGRRAIIHPGVVLSSDGFGLANNRGIWEKVPQLGKVVIGNDVEIGANTTVDRGALEDTVIEDGVKLDNQIQVAHNVKIGAHTAIAGCAGIAGSAVIGKHCAIGGGAGIQGHITIADGVQISGMSVVRQSIHEPGVYTSGTAVQENSAWLRNALRFKVLNELYRKVNQVIKKVEAIEKGK